jgi:hypothetical protein
MQDVAVSRFGSGRVSGTREWFVSGTPYFIPGRVQGDRVELRRVFHAGRKGPDQLCADATTDHAGEK